eukprot:TRINITY_DN12592_c0_g1_i1.p1 TRINITY_DN12592_c0_g1~~TRINITY_DN12592_c0_g1_i1.p1  ORF type:complete len:286 (-),score=25.16 TRINITY_DN12592_c0_g1_i1:137-994(-)
MATQISTFTESNTQPPKKRSRKVYSEAEKQYSCDICKRAYATKTGVANHMRDVHSASAFQAPETMIATKPPPIIAQTLAERQQRNMEAEQLANLIRNLQEFLAVDTETIYRIKCAFQANDAVFVVLDSCFMDLVRSDTDVILSRKFLAKCDRSWTSESLPSAIWRMCGHVLAGWESPEQPLRTPESKCSQQSCIYARLRRVGQCYKHYKERCLADPVLCVIEAQKAMQVDGDWHSRYTKIDPKLTPAFAPLFRKQESGVINPVLILQGYYSATAVFQLHRHSLRS